MWAIKNVVQPGLLRSNWIAYLDRGCVAAFTMFDWIEGAGAKNAYEQGVDGLIIQNRF